MTSHPISPKAGETLPPRIRHWRIDKKLGKGATATVYLGKSLIDGSVVAIKQFSNDLFQNNQHASAYRKMMMNEAGLVGKIVHPNILQTYSVGMESEQKYLVMEYVDSGSLEDFVHSSHSLGLSELLRIFFQCACGLQYSDEIGIIHRDIKPANVLLTKDHVPKITDFGSSMKKGDDLGAISGVGSPAYMSPEQIRERPLNQQTDIYSLGISLFEMISGRKPFSMSSQYETIYKVLHEPAPLLSQFVQGGLHPDLDKILAKAMHKSQAERYQDWCDFIFDLSKILSKITSPAKKVRKVEEVEAFDWLRGCPSLKMFQDNELWDLIAVGSVVAVACGMPVNMRQSSARPSVAIQEDCMRDSIAPQVSEPIRQHGFVLSGALQFYGSDRRISVFNAGDYAIEIEAMLEVSELTPVKSYTLANTVILNIPDASINSIHPVVRNKLATLIKVSGELQSKIQATRYSKEVVESSPSSTSSL